MDRESEIVEREWPTLRTEFEPGTSAKQYSLLRPLALAGGLTAGNSQTNSVISASTSAVLN
jgi:hypothetical protein